MIGLIAATAAGRQAATQLAEALGPDDCRVYESPVGDAVRAAFAECAQLVCFLATGATVRLLAPLLAAEGSDKHTDPGVVCVDEARRFAVALVGGHEGGANALATRVAAALDAQAVVTTATDATDVPGLDTLGLPVSGDLAAVSRALLDGSPVRLVGAELFPLPALPDNVSPDAAADAPTIVIGDALAPAPAPAESAPPVASDGEDGTARHGAAADAAARPGGVPTVRLFTPSLVVGVGASKGAPTEEILGLVRAALADAGLDARSLRSLASVDAKAEEPGLLAAAAELGVPVQFFTAEELAAVTVPNPSDAPLAAVGTPSVAEAAALLAAEASELLVPKRKSTPDGRAAMATVAVARRPVRGRLAIVGLGPGARDLLTDRARAELRRAAVIVGLDQYVDQIRDLLRPGVRIEATGLGAEEERARSAVRLAQQGLAVALIGSGDAGVYAMASPALAEAGADIDVVGVPGVTAAMAAASLLGAPLGHDHVSISLSDLHTPWEVIERRVRAAAEADLVVTFYNPRSRARDWQLPKALSILAEHREAPTTPVGIARSVSRPDEWHKVTTLATLDPTEVDMFTVVTVGNTASREIAGRFVTPRGYRWQE
ncbi:precorrin-3B C(17)-methyltransferase [Streptacidiphilus jiangxiensis]|uniref:Cobalt-precorrin 5A hydrolase / precorrin-3B C17-methyltransferase n=1 Tax=Streptacidiphilus jiangxiensis TaxID=235985 RepID=A0A1H7LBL6_STRJI|nr:precorrin-3B C(17)-methyltransferase [Streptacidiphilus jiangxiensis]SEK95727.1 cobalt-precorrin 5A hydrolase / precorrin-3B C17-methyltransferase [Streptacidiphilus jiangxiensis]